MTEINVDKVDDPTQETGDTLGYLKEEYPSSGESTATCSTLSSLVSVPALESLSDDSAPDSQKPDAKPIPISIYNIKRTKRGKRGRKPKRVPKPSHSEEDILMYEGAMEKKDNGKRIKIMLPQKVGSGISNPKIANSDTCSAENSFVDDVNDTVSSLPKLDVKKAKQNKNKYYISDTTVSGYNSDRHVLEKTHNLDSDSDLSKSQSPLNVNTESFEKQVSELCKDIKRTNLENRKEANASTIPSTSAMNTSKDESVQVEKSAAPSTTLVSSIADHPSGRIGAEDDHTEKRKKIFRKRRGTVATRSFDAIVKRKIMKLTDEIDRIDSIIAKEIGRKNEYYRRGYKVTHQILSNLSSEK